MAKFDERGWEIIDWQCPQCKLIDNQPPGGHERGLTYVVRCLKCDMDMVRIAEPITKFGSVKIKVEASTMEFGRKRENAEYGNRCSIVDWCDLHGVDHGHPVPPSEIIGTAIEDSVEVPMPNGSVHHFVRVKLASNYGRIVPPSINVATASALANGVRKIPSVLFDEIKMKSRFTDRARKSMQFANQEAQRLNHEFIGTEHILIGILKEGTGVASNVLRNMDIKPMAVIKMVRDLLSEGERIVAMGLLPKTLSAQRAIDLAIKSAIELSHNYVGTEHILLGLIAGDGEIGETIAANILFGIGVTEEKVKAGIESLVGGNPAPPSDIDIDAEVVTRDEQKTLLEACSLIRGATNSCVPVDAIPEVIVDVVRAEMNCIGVPPLTWECPNCGMIDDDPSNGMNKRIPGVMRCLRCNMDMNPSLANCISDTPSCSCKSLLYGHDATCPFAENGK